MDWVFKTLAGFLAVRPAETGQDTVLYRAWTYMRSIANVAFVAAFLIIIYSQLSNVGLNNYSIKKLLPRLIVAALLVNLSYFICSIAIDISNILGYSLQDMFIQIRNSLVGPGGNSWNLMSWESLTGFILSGGTAATAGGIVLFTTLSTYGLAGSLFLLLPALVSALMAVLVALVVMAARQAIITLLVIIAPIAFVAYLLPNTEKLFDKWRGLFMTLLVLFPAFSLIFGGSQLAAEAIIQNADSINVVILGMLVQVAPLFITPMLVKLSGSTVSRIAGLINNPNKGIIDRTRNWSQDRAENVKAKRLGTDAGRLALLKRNAQRMDHNRRTREGKRKLHESMADNRYLGSADNKKLYEAQRDVETAKKTIEERLSRDLSIKIKLDPSMLEREMKMRVVTDESSREKSLLDSKYEGMRAGVDPTSAGGVGGVLTNLTERSATANRDLALTSIASQAAKRIQNNNLSDALLRNTAQVEGRYLQDFAAGVDPEGAKAAVAFAVNQQYKAEVDLVNERTQIINKFQLKGEDRQLLAEGGIVTSEIKDAAGNVMYKYVFDGSDEYMQSAAVDKQLGTGSMENILDLIKASGGSLQAHKKDISNAIPEKGLPNKAAFLGGVFIDKVLQGQIKDQATMDDAIIQTYVMGGKFKAEQLAQNDAYAIQMMYNAVSAISPANRTPQMVDNFTELKKTIDSILIEPELKKSTTLGSRQAFERLKSQL
jgi:hypothetical protein